MYLKKMIYTSYKPSVRAILGEYRPEVLTEGLNGVNS